MATEENKMDDEDDGDDGDAPPSWRRASVRYEPFLGRRLAYASRLAAERRSKVPAEKLPPALRDVGARQLRFAISCGALLVFEVCTLLCVGRGDRLFLFGKWDGADGDALGSV
jgi:hypothetical protein